MMENRNQEAYLFCAILDQTARNARAVAQTSEERRQAGLRAFAGSDRGERKVVEGAGRATQTPQRKGGCQRARLQTARNRARPSPVGGRRDVSSEIVCRGGGLTKSQGRLKRGTGRGGAVSGEDVLKERFLRLNGRGRARCWVREGSDAPAEVMRRDGEVVGTGKRGGRATRRVEWCGVVVVVVPGGGGGGSGGGSCVVAGARPACQPARCAECQPGTGRLTDGWIGGEGGMEWMEQQALAGPPATPQSSIPGGPASLVGAQVAAALDGQWTLDGEHEDGSAPAAAAAFVMQREHRARASTLSTPQVGTLGVREEAAPAAPAAGEPGWRPLLGKGAGGGAPRKSAIKWATAQQIDPGRVWATGAQRLSPISTLHRQSSSAVSRGVAASLCESPDGRALPLPCAHRQRMCCSQAMDVPSRLLLNAAPRPNGLVAAAMTKLRPSGSTGTQSRESDGRERHHPPSYLHAPLEPLPKNLISRSHEPASRRHGQPWPALKPRRTMTLLEPPPGLLETSTSPRRPPQVSPPPVAFCAEARMHVREGDAQPFPCCCQPSVALRQGRQPKRVLQPPR
ncbi:hypothetical protein Purlil1_4211 [Purpureocillium lilacinum]|uniref:Uncharacterized protein n=1 Tax=Purpureocillium lilacinum TaxID=33203 RepID=A0ABR0C4Q4_PURLI|nr:hypothetical protein Purlil1_4211 [Purpureocillium lilacinum]